MIILFTLVHVIACFVLILVVLLQSGKAADLAGAFGGMGSQTAFGPRGAATLLSKATTICAIIFMLTSLSLALLGTTQTGSTGSVLEQTKQPAPAQKQAPPGSQQLPVPVPQQQAPAAPQQQPPATPPSSPKK